MLNDKSQAWLPLAKFCAGLNEERSASFALAEHGGGERSSRSERSKKEKIKLRHYEGPDWAVGACT